VRDFQASLVPRPRLYDYFELPDLPLDIEIGAGVGWFALDYCQKNPDRFLVAIEKTIEKFEKFERAFENKNSPENLLPVHAHAINWITHLIPLKSVSNYFILYPNPYPKEGQANKRFHRMPFMARVLETMKKDGEITFATNVESLADEIIDYCERVWGLTLKEEKKLTKKDLKAWTPRTPFEKKYLERGETCWNLVFSRQEKMK
jgi:tRNA (guanine-N7-)-methyltransferase